MVEVLRVRPEVALEFVLTEGGVPHWAGSEPLSEEVLESAFVVEAEAAELAVVVAAVKSHRQVKWLWWENKGTILELGEAANFPKCRYSCCVHSSRADQLFLYPLCQMYEFQLLGEYSLYQ